jgi:agmatinase
MDSEKIIFKIPFDLGTNKRGAEKAPDQIELEFKKTTSNENFVNIDVSQDFLTTHKNILNQANRTLNNSHFIALGGDHSTSYSLIKAFKQHYPQSALIVLDAHFDCQKPFDLPTNEDYLRLLIENKIIDPNDILIIGARSATQEELDFIKKYKIRHLSPQNFEIKKLKDFLNKYQEFYLTIDIDAIDPGIAPGTAWREPKGLNKDQVESIVNSLPYGKKFSADIVELSPNYDRNNTTTKLTANILLSLINPHKKLFIVLGI